MSEARPSTAVRYHEDFLGLHFNIFPGAVQVSLGRPKNTIRVTARERAESGAGRHLPPRGRISYSRPFPGALMFYLRLESLLLSLAPAHGHPGTALPSTAAGTHH